MQAPETRVGEARSGDVDAALAQLFGRGVRPLRMEEALFDAALEGWRRQAAARHFTVATTKAREGIVRRFQAQTDLWPWQWRPVHADEWIEDLSSPPRRLAVSTLRGYQGSLRGFMDYLVDGRYPWVSICEQEFGCRPVQILDESNAIGHVVEYEGDPRRRPLTREELVLFFDHLDAQVSGRRALRRKGSLAAFRDAVLFKAYVAQIRPLYGFERHPGLFVTERGSRVSTGYVSRRFAAYREELGLPEELTPHSLRHSYVTHLIEDGWDELFVRMQVGHRFASTTAIYTGVSGDYKNEVMRRALRDQLARGGEEDG